MQACNVRLARGYRSVTRTYLAHDLVEAGGVHGLCTLNDLQWSILRIDAVDHTVKPFSQQDYLPP